VAKHFCPDAVPQIEKAILVEFPNSLPSDFSN
jgi:hypothetical protein